MAADGNPEVLEAAIQEGMEVALAAAGDGGAWSLDSPIHKIH